MITFHNTGCPYCQPRCPCCGRPYGPGWGGYQPYRWFGDSQNASGDFLNHDENTTTCQCES